MLTYVYLGTNDLKRATRFYDATLAPLGLRRCITGTRIGIGSRPVGERTRTMALASSPCGLANRSIIKSLR
jgi:hypothetical protein